MSVRTWLSEIGMAKYADAFELNDIGEDLLDQLDDQSLKDIGITSTGHRLRILAAIKSRQQPDTSTSPRAPNVRPQEAVERRQLTILFCDLVGSTVLSRQLDPERLREVMQTYQRTCAEVIERYEGHVAQYLGDGLMIYFGYPRAHEDDAERSVRAALDVIAAVSRIAVTETRLEVRIGIATGPVVVGETGSGDASVPKLAVGETPNLAARLQGLAGPNEIVIAPFTRRLLGSTFEMRDLGERALKGLVEPVSAWQVLRPAKVQGRFEAARGEAQWTRWVGRESELALLWDRWQQAVSGEGQLVLIGGEPGIGKSRITQALRTRIGSDPHRELRYQCSTFHTQSALYPVIERLEIAAGFARDDTPEQKLDKLEAFISHLGDEVPSLFANLLSLPVQRYPESNDTPQKQKDRLLAALVDQIIALSREAPVLMVFEDAHWADPTTHEALDLLVSRLASMRVLLIITHRPEYSPRWGGEAHVTALSLNRLNRRLAAQLTENVSGGKPLPAEVLEQIVAKTDGVPLFVEELTKAVMESTLVRETDSCYELTGPLPPLAIPSTLHDSLMAHHLTLAELPLRAATQWREAGARATRRVALQEAISHCQQGLSIALAMGQEAEGLVLDLHIDLAMAWMAHRG